MYTLLKYININDPYMGDNTPLKIAIRINDLDIIKTLILNNVNVNLISNNTSPLLYAIIHNHKHIVKILADNGANVNEVIISNKIYKNNLSLLMYCIKYNVSMEIINILLLHQADINYIYNFENLLTLSLKDVNNINFVIYLLDIGVIYNMITKDIWEDYYNRALSKNYIIEIDQLKKIIK